VTCKRINWKYASHAPDIGRRTPAGAQERGPGASVLLWCQRRRGSGLGNRRESYNRNLWITHPFEGAAYLPR
jgi:hypothetical protein